MPKNVGKKYRGEALPRSPRYDALIKGHLSAQDLDLEELQRGQLRDKNGNFTGRPPDWIPRHLHQAMIQELRHRMEQRFMEYAIPAIEEMVDIMKTGETRDIVRLQAATYIVERVMGKIPNQDKVSVEIAPWQKAIEGGELVIDVEAEDVEPEIEVPVRRPRRKRTDPA